MCALCGVCDSGFEMHDVMAASLTIVAFIDYDSDIM